MRDKTVDILKGFAILLMVMGHFLAAATSHLDGGEPHNGWLVGQWIYSFHMPLFFFLTGYLSVKAPSSLHNFGCKVLRKVQTLLMPGVAFMLIGYWFTGGWEMAWFLKVLFQLTVVFACVRYFVEKYKISMLWELVIHAIVFVVWFVGSHYIKGTWAAEHLWIHNAAVRYPYIVLGYVFARLNWKQLLQKNNWLLTLSMVVYAATYYVANWLIGGTFAAYIKSYVVAPAAIMVCMGLVQRVNVDSKLSHALCYMGERTLAIYLLSNYFLLTLPGLADWWIVQNNVTSVVMQLVTSFGASALCITLCLVMEWIISQSNILNFICFGKSIKK